MDLKKLSPLAQLMVFVGFCLVILLVSYFLYFKGQLSTLNSVREQRKAVQEEVEKAKKKKLEAERLKREVAYLDEKLKTLREILPERKDVSDIIKKIQSLAYNYRLEISKFTPKPEVQRDLYIEWPFSITMAGNYHDLGYFLDHLSRYKKIFNVDNIVITALPRQTPLRSISISWDAITYIAHERPPAPPPPRRRAPREEKEETI
ncbi:MAG: type 4a pilus biogenesis protein PilO [Candidatus Aminicenantia bacterium]